jgi:hypothetical protein
MRASLVDTPLRVLTWCCVVLLAVLSLLPAQQMVRTGLPRQLELIDCPVSIAANLKGPDPKMFFSYQRGSLSRISFL